MERDVHLYSFPPRAVLICKVQRELKEKATVVLASSVRGWSSGLSEWLGFKGRNSGKEEAIEKTAPVLYLKLPQSLEDP